MRSLVALALLAASLGGCITGDRSVNGTRHDGGGVLWDVRPGISWGTPWSRDPCDPGSAEPSGSAPVFPRFLDPPSQQEVRLRGIVAKTSPGTWVPPPGNEWYASLAAGRFTAQADDGVAVVLYEGTNGWSEAEARQVALDVQRAWELPAEAVTLDSGTSGGYGWANLRPAGVRTDHWLMPHTEAGVLQGGDTFPHSQLGVWPVHRLPTSAPILSVEEAGPIAEAAFACVAREHGVPASPGLAPDVAYEIAFQSGAFVFRPAAPPVLREADGCTLRSVSVDAWTGAVLRISAARTAYQAECRGAQDA